MNTNGMSFHTPSTTGVGSNGQKIFSESGNVAYQIEVEELETIMQGNTLTLHTPHASGVGLKGPLLKLGSFFFY